MAEYILTHAKTGEFLTAGERDFESEQEMNEFKHLQRQNGRIVHFKGERETAEAA